MTGSSKLVRSVGREVLGDRSAGEPETLPKAAAARASGLSPATLDRWQRAGRLGRGHPTYTGRTQRGSQKLVGDRETGRVRETQAQRSIQGVRASPLTPCVPAMQCPLAHRVQNSLSTRENT